jgi:hypothetical protein
VIPVQLVGRVVEPGGDRVDGPASLERIRGEQLQQSIAVGRLLDPVDPILFRRSDDFAANLESAVLITQTAAEPEGRDAWQRLAAVLL